MRIHIKEEHSEVVVPGLPSFAGGADYIVAEETGKLLVERGQAVEVTESKKKTPNSTKNA